MSEIVRKPPVDNKQQSKEDKKKEKKKKRLEKRIEKKQKMKKPKVFIEVCIDFIIIYNESLRMKC